MYPVWLIRRCIAWRTYSWLKMAPTCGDAKFIDMYVMPHVGQASTL